MCKHGNLSIGGDEFRITRVHNNYVASPQGADGCEWIGSALPSTNVKPQHRRAPSHTLGDTARHDSAREDRGAGVFLRPHFVSRDREWAILFLHARNALAIKGFHVSWQVRNVCLLVAHRVGLVGSRVCDTEEERAIMIRKYNY